MMTVNAFAAALAEERAAATTALAQALHSGDEVGRRDAFERLADLKDIAERALDNRWLGTV